MDELWRVCHWEDKERVRKRIEETGDINTRIEDDERSIDGECHHTLLTRACCDNCTKMVRILIREQVDVNKRETWRGKTPLIEASRKGRTEIVKMLIQTKAKISEKDDLGKTALIWAIYGGHTGIVEMLIEAGAKVNERNNVGETAVIKASKGGHTEIVKVLMAAEVNINEKEDRGGTALIWASRSGHTEIAKLLIQAEAKINEKDDLERPALIWASYRGHIEIVRMLVEAEAELNEKDRERSTAMQWAMNKGHTDIVKMLIQAKARVNDKDDLGRNPLMWASIEGHIEIVEMLIMARAKINETDHINRTALVWASIEGRTQIVKLLIEAEAEINHKDDEGKTALIEASYGGHTDIVQMLIKENAHINEKNNDGRTALAVAIEKRNRNIAIILIQARASMKELSVQEKEEVMLWASQEGQGDVTNQLIKAGVSPDATDKEGNSALMWAIRNRHADVTIALLRAKAVIDDKSQETKQALLWAVQQGYTEVTNLLIETGVSPDVTDYEGNSVLTWAIRKRHIDAVLLLLRAKAALNTNSEVAKEALLWAVQKGYTEVGLILLELGVSPNVRDDRGITALKLASERGNKDLVLPLINAKAAIDKSSDEARKAMLWSSQLGRQDVLSVLIQADASVNVKDMDEKTPLMLASQYGHTDCVILLVIAGASLNVKHSLTGYTALLLAAKHGHVTTAEILLNSGAEDQVKDEEGLTAADYVIHHAEMSTMPAENTILRRLYNKDIELVEFLDYLKQTQDSIPPKSIYYSLCGKYSKGIPKEVAEVRAKGYTLILLRLFGIKYFTKTNTNTRVAESKEDETQVCKLVKDYIDQEIFNWFVRKRHCMVETDYPSVEDKISRMCAIAQAQQTQTSEEEELRQLFNNDIIENKKSPVQKNTKSTQVFSNKIPENGQALKRSVSREEILEIVSESDECPQVYSKNDNNFVGFLKDNGSVKEAGVAQRTSSLSENIYGTISQNVDASESNDEGNKDENAKKALDNKSLLQVFPGTRKKDVRGLENDKRIKDGVGTEATAHKVSMGQGHFRSGYKDGEVSESTDDKNIDVPEEEIQLLQGTFTKIVIEDQVSEGTKSRNEDIGVTTKIEPIRTRCRNLLTEEYKAHRCGRSISRIERKQISECLVQTLGRNPVARETIDAFDEGEPNKYVDTLKCKWQMFTENVWYMLFSISLMFFGMYHIDIVMDNISALEITRTSDHAPIIVMAWIFAWAPHFCISWDLFRKRKSILSPFQDKHIERFILARFPWQNVLKEKETLFCSVLCIFQLFPAFVFLHLLTITYQRLKFRNNPLAQQKIVQAVQNMTLQLSSVGEINTTIEATAQLLLVLLYTSNYTTNTYFKLATAPVFASLSLLKSYCFSESPIEIGVKGKLLYCAYLLCRYVARFAVLFSFLNAFAWYYTLNVAFIYFLIIIILRFHETLHYISKDPSTDVNRFHIIALTSRNNWLSLVDFHSEHPSDNYIPWKCKLVFIWLGCLLEMIMYLVILVKGSVPPNSVICWFFYFSPLFSMLSFAFFVSYVRYGHPFRYLLYFREKRTQ